MKKLSILVALALALTSVFVLLSCNEAMDKSLPKTNVDLFISGNSVVFPRGTSIIDIYNTITFLFQEADEWHYVSNGEWKSILTVINDGLINQTWQSNSFTRVRHTRTETRGFLVYSVYLCDNINSHRLSFNWHGDLVAVNVSLAWRAVIEGDIAFTF